MKLIDWILVLILIGAYAGAVISARNAAKSFDQHADEALGLVAPADSEKDYND